MPTNPLIFNPSPAQADQVIHDLGSPHLTLRDVAELYNTTIQSLTLWIALPDTSARLANINNAVVARSRHVACNYLARATETVITSLDAYIDEEKHIPVRPNSIEDREQRRRSRQTACHGVSLLLRIARFNPAPPRPSDPTRKRRYTTAHSTRINEVLTKLGAPPSISADEQAEHVAANSPSAPPALCETLPPPHPTRGSTPTATTTTASPTSSPISTPPQTPSPPRRVMESALATSVVEPQAPTPNGHNTSNNHPALPAHYRPGKHYRPPPKRGDPDWQPWMANGELPLSVEKKLRQQPASTTPPSTTATLQARAGAPQPFTPLTISAKHASGNSHSCPTNCSNGRGKSHPP